MFVPKLVPVGLKTSLFGNEQLKILNSGNALDHIQRYGRQHRLALQVRERCGFTQKKTQLSGYSSQYTVFEENSGVWV